MKKALLIIPLMGILWSCKKTSEKLPNTISVTQPSKPISFAARDGVYDVLGFGYNLTGDYAVTASTTFPVIDIARLKADYSDRFLLNLDHNSITYLIEGASEETYLQKKSEKLNAGAGNSKSSLIYSASVNVAFSDTLSSLSKYIISSYNIYIQRKSLSINAPASLLQNYLSPAFATDINTQTPDYIVSHYGTHVLMNIKLGGTLDIMYRAETRNSARESASAIGIKASIGKTLLSVHVDDSVSTATSDVNKNFNQTLSVATHGGDPSVGIITSIPIDGTPITPFNTAPWQNSVTDENSEFINIGENGLMLISDLVADPTKKAALETYIDQYLAAHKINAVATQVYEFSSPILNVHYYSIDANNYQLYPTAGYHPNGQPFKAFATATTSTPAIPIYQFSKPDNQDHVLTATSSHPDWTGYVNNGVQFYAYSNTNHPAGSMPLYEFTKTGDHFYSTNISANAGTGYAYNGQPFYVVPN